MNSAKELFRFKYVYITLISLPYFTYNLNDILNSSFFLFNQLVLLIAFLVLIDIVLKVYCFLFNEYFISSLSILLSIIFFYGIYISSFIQKKLYDLLHFEIRGRTIIIILIISVLLILIKLWRKKVNYIYLNTLFLILSSISLISSLSNYKKDVNNKLISDFIPLSEDSNNKKSIILIISDEYAAPDELYKAYKDSSVYDFTERLKQKGWITKNSFFSFETSTIHSLSSLFNFNLSKKNNYSAQAVSKIGAKMIVESKLADSLKLKNIKVLNFGIFHLGKEKYLNRLYPYPISFIEDIFKNTIYYLFKINKANIDGKGLERSSNPIEIHNKYLFTNLCDTINKKTNDIFFAYTHLIMPHMPFQYGSEFKVKNKNDLSNYLLYWNFTNTKLEKLLSELIEKNMYRIILTGDHGYRNDEFINPHNTFTAFYGFEQKSIQKIQSVQDLGSLIYSNFNLSNK